MNPKRDAPEYNKGRSKPLILHIDDSDKVLQVTELIFSEIGVKAIGALDAEKGISLARKEQPDLILMDIVMPGMNGFEAIKLLRSDPKTKDIPILIVTGANQEHDVEEGLKAGANGYLIKPIKRERLIFKLEEWLELPRFF